MFQRLSQCYNDATFVLDRVRARITSLFFLSVAFGCVDRVFFDIPIPNQFSISIGGYISDRPGPYEIGVFRTFDIESNESLRSGVSAKSVVISDHEGNSETLSQIEPGIYQTSASGMRGKIGAAYRVTVELPDGRIYESTYDTLRKGGQLDTAWYQIAEHYAINGIERFFDIYTDASTNVHPATTHFMWLNRTTYEALTKPEDEPWEAIGGVAGQCYMDPQTHRCNYKDPCSGIKNFGSNYLPRFERVKECECCYCWYDIYNSDVILNDKMGSVNGRYVSVRSDHIPLTGWLLMFKMRTEITLLSLSPQAYTFWKGIRDQRTAVSSLFQPVTGKVHGNFTQTAGADNPAEGLFYATSISVKEFYIKRKDVSEGIIPTTDFPHSRDFSCLRLAPNAVTVKPPFWSDSE